MINQNPLEKILNRLRLLDLVKNVSKENKTRLKRGILSQLRFLVQGGQRTLPVLIPSLSRYGNNIRFVFEMDVLPELFIDHRIFVNIKFLSFTNFLRVLFDEQPLQLENGVLLKMKCCMALELYLQTMSTLNLMGTHLESSLPTALCHTRP